MSLHQYRLIGPAVVTDGMREHIPRLLPFIYATHITTKVPAHVYSGKEYDPLFAHELAHVIEIFERGQVERLKMENLGWPMNNFSTFTAKAATAECKVFAMQWLMEEMFTGKIDGNDILGLDSVVTLLNSPRFWTRKDQFHEWASTRGVRDRLLDAVEEYKPKMKTLLTTTVDYMVDECAEFL